MTTQEILTLAIALSISVIVLIIARQLSTSKKSSNAYNVTIYKPKKKRKLDSGKSKLLDIYKFLMRIPLYNNHVRMVERQYTILYPNDQKTARKKATKLILWSTLISILSLIAVIVFSGTVYMIVVTIVLIVVLNTYLVRMRIESEEMRLLEQFNSFMGDVRHFYFDSQMVDEAVNAAIEIAKPAVRVHAERIAEIFTAPDLVEATQKYNNIVPNRFIKSFVALCVITIQYGDKKVKDESNFLLNLKNLKQEIYIEILKKQKLKSAFSMLVAITIIPVFALDWIKNWAINNMPELDAFYNGTKGVIMSMLILGATLITYSIILRLKNMDINAEDDHVILRWIDKRWPFKQMLDNYMHANYAKMKRLDKDLKRIGQSITARLFMLKRILLGFALFTFVTAALFVVHANNKTRLISSVNNLDSITSGATEDNIVTMRDSIIYYTTLYRYNTVLDSTGKVVSSSDSLFTNGSPVAIQTKTGRTFKAGDDAEVRTDGILNKSTMTAILASDKELKSNALCEATATEILSRIIEYNKEYVRWYEILIAIAVGIAGFYYPLLVKILQTVAIQRAMEDEVIQYQTIISMLVYIDRMTIDTVIEWMEEFGVIFKESLTECMNRLNAGDADALDRLIEEEPFEMFDRVIENLKMSDRIGVAKAFNEVDVERANYQDKRRQENEIEITNKGAMAQFLSMIPLGIVILAYLIYPLMTESLGQLSSSMSSAL